MDELNEQINSINTERLLSIIFIVIGLGNIVGDEILKKGIITEDENLVNTAEKIFFWGLVFSFIVYLVIVTRNYKFYIEKKESGEDSSNELIRLFGSCLILVGFILVFYYFIQGNLDSDNPPVL